MALIFVITPTSGGTDCFLQHETDYGTFSMLTLMRQTNLFATGFFVLGAYGGMDWMNVTMIVSVVTAYWITAMEYGTTFATKDGAPNGMSTRR